MKSEDFIKRLEALGVDSNDVREIFSRSGGPGGQNVNKVSTAVELLVVSEKVRVRSQQGRSQAQNRELARELLILKLETKRHDAALKVQQESQKKRRQKRQRPLSVKKKFQEIKRHRALIRRERKCTNLDD